MQVAEIVLSIQFVRGRERARWDKGSVCKEAVKEKNPRRMLPSPQRLTEGRKVGREQQGCGHGFWLTSPSCSSIAQELSTKRSWSCVVLLQIRSVAMD